MSTVLLETKSLTKKFGKETAVSDVSLTVQKKQHLRSAWTKWSWKIDDT